MRDVQPVMLYDRDAVLSQLDSASGYWALFGGEALIISIKDIEELLKKGFEKWGKTGVQTNGTLITEAHIDLFAKYNTHVGISLDGPDDLNDSRWAGTLEATRKATARTLWAIDRLVERAKEHPHLIPSIIVTLHAGNAAPDRWPRMREWIQSLDAKGIAGLNLHVMEMDYKASEWYLPHEQLMTVFNELWDLSSTFKTLKIMNFKEITDLLMGKDQEAVCVWHACDPWNTSAVQGLEGNGEPSHCSRTNKDGKNWLPAEGIGVASKQAIGDFVGQRFHERQLSLYVTSQEHGGCHDCRFWMMCQGQCPGTGESNGSNTSGDWRLRSTYCQTWKGLFEEGERRLLKEGQQPISLHPDRKKMEAIMYGAWKQHSECAMSTAIKLLETNPELIRPDGSVTMQNFHLDVPHGNSHEDHTDHSKVNTNCE